MRLSWLNVCRSIGLCAQSRVWYDEIHHIIWLHSTQFFIVFRRVDTTRFAIQGTVRVFLWRAMFFSTHTIFLGKLFVWFAIIIYFDRLFQFHRTRNKLPISFQATGKKNVQKKSNDKNKNLPATNNRMNEFDKKCFHSVNFYPIHKNSTNLVEQWAHMHVMLLVRRRRLVLLGEPGYEPYRMERLSWLRSLLLDVHVIL